MDKSDVIARLAAQGEAIQCGSYQNGLPRFLAKHRNDRGRRTNPMSRDLQRKAKQSSAVLCKMDCRGFLRNPAMTEDDGQIRCHCETCNARRSNPVRFLSKWIAAVSCETSQ